VILLRYAAERGDGVKGLIMDTHRFYVGQNVRLSLGPIHQGNSIACKIAQLLPFDGESFQYRVKNDAESFERMANEHDLTAAPTK
jgi:hypothetical protein